MSKNIWCYRLNHEVNHPASNEELRSLVETIVKENPGYGYRRIHHELLQDHGIRTGWLMAMMDPISRLVASWAVGPGRNRTLPRTCF